MTKTAYDELKTLIFSGIDSSRAAAIEKMCKQMQLAIGLVARLRGPKGCPWDLEQTHLTLRPYLIEEAYEVLDVLDRCQKEGSFTPQDRELFCEELGDLLLQVILHSQLSWERGEFTVGDVGERMAQKLVYRHPHVFGDVKASDSAQVLQNWEALKKKEGKKGLLDGLPKNLPSLQRAARIGEKANRVGFDWKDWKGAWDKVEEETRELKEAIDKKSADQIEHELGDLFFSLCNLARHLRVQPEDAHRKAIARFEERFKKLEEICRVEGVDLQTASLETLDAVWDRVKRQS